MHVLRARLPQISAQTKPYGLRYGRSRADSNTCTPLYNKVLELHFVVPRAVWLCFWLCFEMVARGVAYPLRGCTPGTRRRRHHREDDSHYAETVQEAHRCRRWTYWLVKIKDLNLSTRRYPRHLSNLYTLLATRCLSAITTTSRCPSAPTTTSRCLSAPTTTTRCPSAPTATTRCPSAPTTTTRCESPPPVIC